MSKLKTAQELIKTNNSSVMAGFNMFIYGHPPITFGDGYHDAYDRMQGYEFAQKMAKEDGIAFTKVFKCKQGDCHPKYNRNKQQTNYSKAEQSYVKPLFWQYLC